MSGERGASTDRVVREDPGDSQAGQRAEAVRGSGAPAATAEDGIASLSVALAVRKAARTGVAVSPVDDADL
jgi:predicted dehydrogenase